jgi:hypothetical protein
MLSFTDYLVQIKRQDFPDVKENSCGRHFFSHRPALNVVGIEISKALFRCGRWVISLSGI